MPSRCTGQELQPRPNIVAMSRNSGWKLRLRAGVQRWVRPGDRRLRCPVNRGSSRRDGAAPFRHGHGSLWAEMVDLDRPGGAWPGKLSALGPDADDAGGGDPALAGWAQHRFRLRVPAG